MRSRIGGPRLSDDEGRAVSTGLKGILSTVGNTPLIELDRLISGFSSHVFAKVERFNPGGSIKDRSALGMLMARLRDGQLVPGRSTVIESSSGNLAIGLAQICGYFGLRFICVVDFRTTQQNLAILRAYGADVRVVTEPDPATGELLPQRLRLVAQLLEETPDSYCPDQYTNPLNPQAHLTTMAEIDTALDGRIDYLVVSAGTTGTLGGCAEYIRRRKLPTKVVAVDAIGSVLFGSTVACERLIPGHGNSVPPRLLRREDAHRVVHVSDLDCVVGCRRLVQREAVLAGGSSGAVVAALGRIAAEIPPGSNCVLILPGGGDRYLDTVYDDQWVRHHFGEVSHLWKGPNPIPEPDQRKASAQC
ncbi:2,3-diaminopropionate biosynthesis protein SbnA [Streptomyces griseoviridis]|uniref:N-(2-amino-2-carboxyethyl)-L-glutamate synthase n=1 Tax=Streptomyces griseoviridis TaxID=45398 RepID=A0A3Q9KWC2_STRGD|nr:2,3-diaminopropionate biosynthesis protein SbnA [Streptomyces griseoviridis]AZS85890.1 2,3-diaminopropionate biosynthesis protein SbnA [Streptomyces griseoviridis]QCN87250.1 2,3-diaminopropionate biosynthesis protein SbnA [Streptomyces griseoviridis]